MESLQILQDDSPWLWFDYGSNLVVNRAINSFASFERWMRDQGLVHLVDYYYGHKMDFFYLPNGQFAPEIEFRSVPTAVKIRDKEIVSLAMIKFPFLKSEGPTYES